MMNCICPAQWRAEQWTVNGPTPHMPGCPDGKRKEQHMTCTGKFRVYFNRHGAEPLMWCVAPDAGGWEIAVRDVGISTHAETVYRKKATADEDDGRPSAWIAVEGMLIINAAGFATIGDP